MKVKNIKYWILASLFITIGACKPEIDAPAASAGSANFSKYIAVGNSLTAGYADGGLYLEGQKVAYPNIIAEQLNSVGIGNFTSPFFTEAQANGSGYVRLSGFNADGTPITANVIDKTAYLNTERTRLTKYTDEIQNLGIPGMRLDLGAAAPTFSSANMFFERLLPDAQVGNTTYLSFVQNKNHTFFSFWLGNNDVLGWATNGGVTEVGPASATTNLTSTANFTNAYNAFIGTLTAQGQKGVVATIPDVTSVPFFNTVTVAALLKGAQAINPNANAIYIQSNGGTRIATSKDLIVLTFQSTGLFGKPTPLIGDIPANPYPYGLHENNPIASKYVLDEEEVAIAKERVTEFNTVIKNIATAKDLALVDTYAILNGIKTPANYEGILVSSAFITGNAFSLDGIHLTPIGNAIIANEFIKTINKKYNSNISTVAVSSYNGVKFP